MKKRGNTLFKMDHAHSHTPWLLLCIVLAALVWVMRTPGGVTFGTGTTPTPPPIGGLCSPDNTMVGGILVSNPSFPAQSAGIVSDPADPRYVRVTSNGVLTRERFQAGSVSRFLYQPRGSRFAFVANYYGQTQLMEYQIGGETPLAHAPIQALWNNAFCYSRSGRYLFAVALTEMNWTLLVRDETTYNTFSKYAILGDPERLRTMLPSLDNIQGIPYDVSDDSLFTEIQNWLR